MPRPIMFLLLFTLLIATTQCALYKAVYWNARPFIFRDEQSGNLTGILPDIVMRTWFYCGYVVDNQELVEYTYPIDDSAELLSLFHSDTRYGEGKLENLTADRTLWFPYMKLVETADLQKFVERNATHQRASYISSAVVVEKSWRISLEYKFLSGLFECRVILTNTFLVTITFSVITWLIERNINENISVSFLRGVADSFWMNSVTFMTVGYGDVSPKSPVTKCLVIAWMFFGLFYASMMTAIVLDTVSSDNKNSFARQNTIAVIDNSFEKQYLERNYKAQIRATKTEEEAVRLVRSGEVDAAVVNKMTAAWYQGDFLKEEYNGELSFVAEIEMHIPIMFAFSNPVESQEMTDLWQCVNQNLVEIVDYTFGKYALVAHIEDKSVLSFAESFHFLPFQAVMALTVVFLLLGLLIDLRARQSRLVKTAPVVDDGVDAGREEQTVVDLK